MKKPDHVIGFLEFGGERGSRTPWPYNKIRISRLFTVGYVQFISKIKAIAYDD